MGGQDQLNLHDTRTLFDSLVTDLPKYTFSHIQRGNKIVNNPDFENAVVKIQAGLENTLTTREKNATSHLLVDGNTENDDNIEDLGYAARKLYTAHAEKKRRVNKSKYMVKHCIATSNICERLFSTARHQMSYLRKHMYPETLNMILFLKGNRALWKDAAIFQDILNEQAVNQKSTSSCTTPNLNFGTPTTTSSNRSSISGGTIDNDTDDDDADDADDDMDEDDSYHSTML